MNTWKTGILQQWKGIAARNTYQSLCEIRVWLILEEWHTLYGCSFLTPEQCCVHNALNAGLSLKQISQCFDKGLSRVIIMIMIVFTEILIFCMFEWREKFTYSPRPATRHRPGSDAGRPNAGPTSGQQHRWQAIYNLVWICDPTLRVYAFSKFSIRIQYRLVDIPCIIYAMMIWRYL